MEMLSGFQIEKENRKKIDPVLFYIMMLLLGTGLTFLFSSSYPNALRLDKAPEYFLKRQLVMVGAGIIGAAVFAAVPIEKLKKSVPFFLISFFYSISCCSYSRQRNTGRKKMDSACRAFFPAF